ncbi:MAG: YdjY domain-containing protein, partial [Candidatus Poribacteria bacterium]
GLYAAQQWGAHIPTEVWTKAVSWIIKLQRPDGGWNYSGEGMGPFAVDSYGSMTATAVMGLKAAGLGPNNEATKRGIDWLTKYYSITRNPGSFYWHYYFMLALQRAMDIPPKQDTIGGHDWYHEMASFLVSKQMPDGSWIADTPISATGSSAIVQDLSDWAANRGDIMTTAFAVMFLTKAMPQPAKVDLGFGKQNIMFSKSDPVEGEQVTIRTSIANMTNNPVENVKIAFYDGDPKSAGVPIGTIQTISNLSGNEIKELSTIWEAKGAGEHKIYVVIDPSNTIDEASKDNNIAFSQIFVGGKTTPAIPGIIQISDGVYRLGKIDIDLNKKTVTLYGKINMTAGIIELLACTKIGKLHESLLVMDVEPIHLQTALILLGLEFGGGVRFQGDPLTPKGDKVQIW